MITENNLRLDNKTIVITGASGYIGSSISSSLSMLGADLILVDINKEKLSKLSNNIKNHNPVNIKIIKADLSKPKDVSKILKYISDNKLVINGLVNSIGMVGTSKTKGWNSTFLKQEQSAWEKALDINLTSIFFFIQKIEKYMNNAINPSIVNISSIYGTYAPDYSIYKDTKINNPAAYSVSKAGLTYLSKWLASSLAPKIRINSISPGGIFRNQDKKFVKKYIEKTLLKRMATEDDIAGCVAFLLSSLSSYITGQDIIVDGGWGI